jgi:hypothetical protein
MWGLSLRLGSEGRWCARRSDARGGREIGGSGRVEGVHVRMVVVVTSLDILGVRVTV